MTSQPLPYESHVQSLFSFALGAISGVEGMRQLMADERLAPLEDLEGYVFAGGGLDEQAGDALLRSARSWFIVEMKRGPSDLKAELSKPRVIHLKSKLAAWRTSTDQSEQALWKTSQRAHLFVYGTRRKGSGPAIKTSSYTEWLQAGAEPASADLVEFLFRVGKPPVTGFTWEQLVKYLAAMNEKSGGLPVDRMRDLIDRTFTVGVTAAGSMTVNTMASLMPMVKDAIARSAMVPQRATGATQPQAIAPAPVPSQSGPRPRPGR